jgi:hypothetical protein
MHIVDHLFVLLLFVVQPIHGAMAYRRYIARIEAGAASNRVRLYTQTIVLEWVALAVLATTWYALGRPATELGFVAPQGRGFLIGVGILVLVTGFLVYQWRGALSASDEYKAKQKDALGSLVHFLPQSRRDYRYFTGVSITAGIVEEILYRGFAIWYLVQLMPVWAAIVISSIAFGLGHSYQGAGGVARVSLLGLAFGAFYIFTGSIWLPMIGHAILDIVQGATILAIMRRRP